MNEPIPHTPRSRRYPVELPVAIGSTPRHRLMAMTRNASDTGILLTCPSGFEIGATVHLMFKVSDDDDFEHLEGYVVRHDVNETESVWRHLMAVRFTQPLDHLSPRLSALQVPPS